MPLLLHEWVRTLAVSVRYRTKVILADADDALIIHWVVALEDFIFKGVLSLSGSAGGWTWQRWVAQTSLTFSSAKWNKKSFMYCRDVTNSKTFLNLYVQCNTSNFGKMFLFNYCILGFGRTRIETLWVLSLFKRSHCQLTNVVTIQGCIPCFFVIEKVSGFSHLPEGTIVVQRTFHAATLAFALKIIKQCSKLTVLICVFSSVNSDEWHCYQLFLVFRWVGYPDENSYVL